MNQSEDCRCRSRRRSLSTSRLQIRDRIISHINNTANIIYASNNIYRTQVNSNAIIDGDDDDTMNRRSFLNEGNVQLTSLDSLVTRTRYFFLFDDLLLITKQKASNSYKLKEKLFLNQIWIKSDKSSFSFIIGWPKSNFIAHFIAEDERNRWYEILYDKIQENRSKTIAKFTTLPVCVRIYRRCQVMKKRIENDRSASEALAELVKELELSKDEEFHLIFDPGNNEFGSVLQGPEILFCLVLNYVRVAGFRLSEQQFERIDTFPLNRCRLILSTANFSKSNTAQMLVTHFKRVLSRSGSKQIFGRPLDALAPPQPILTMIDHLLMSGLNVEGIFRKSPKQSTTRMLKTQLDCGSVPDFCQFSPHVTAALLKEYLRDIPGKLLLSGNYDLWKSAIALQEDERKVVVKRLLQLLPSSHTVLLSSFLRLLRAVTNSAHTKMNARSLAVCVAPSLLDCPSDDERTENLPELAEYLIIKAPELLEPFHDAQLAISSSISNDSGLSDLDSPVEVNSSSVNDENRTDSNGGSTLAKSIRTSCSSISIRCISPKSPVTQYAQWKRYSLRSPTSGYYTSSLSIDDEDVETEVENAVDNDRTPVLSRENSNIQSIQLPIIRRKNSKKELLTEKQVETQCTEPISYQENSISSILFQKAIECQKSAILRRSIPILPRRQPRRVSPQVKRRCSLKGRTVMNPPGIDDSRHLSTDTSSSHNLIKKGSLRETSRLHRNRSLIKESFLKHDQDSVDDSTADDELVHRKSLPRNIKLNRSANEDGLFTSACKYQFPMIVSPVQLRGRITKKDAKNVLGEVVVCDPSKQERSVQERNFRYVNSDYTRIDRHNTHSLHTLVKPRKQDELSKLSVKEPSDFPVDPLVVSGVAAVVNFSPKGIASSTLKATSIRKKFDQLKKSMHVEENRKIGLGKSACARSCPEESVATYAAEAKINNATHKVTYLRPKAHPSHIQPIHLADISKTTFKMKMDQDSDSNYRRVNDELPGSQKWIAIEQSKKCANDFRISRSFHDQDKAERTITVEHSSKVVGSYIQACNAQKVKWHQQNHDEYSDSQTAVPNRSLRRTSTFHSTEQYQKRNDRLSDSRKNNHAILMEPFEVNWSVNELRSIFLRHADAPIRLDTDYCVKSR